MLILWFCKFQPVFVDMHIDLMYFLTLLGKVAV